MTLRFDDGTKCQYEHAYKIMQKYGLVGSIFVIGSRLWSKYYIPVNQLLEMQNNGWEIGYHSWSHNNKWIVDTNVYKKETDSTELKKQGLKITSFCFPHSAYNRRVLHYCRKEMGYKALVGIPSKDCDSMREGSPRDHMYRSYSVNPFTKFHNIEKRLYEAVEEDEYLIFMIHKMAPDPSIKRGEISTERFEKIIRLLKKFQDAGLIKVVTLHDAHHKISTSALSAKG